jgi:hypothetical protein
MAGVYLKIKQVDFQNGRRVSYSTPVNGIIDGDWVYLPSGTDTVCYPKDTIKSVTVGATPAHLDTALSSADALFT